MRITDNMLRAISHAYLNNQPGIFLIKAGLYDITDDFTFLKKSYTTVGLLTSLINTATTESERAFFSYDTTTSQYSTKIAKEKNVVLDAVTVKEFIIGNGLVYSEFLDYVYGALTKYNQPVPDISILDKSVNVTLAKLEKVSTIKDAELKCFSIFDAISEVDAIVANTQELSKELENKVSSIDRLNKALAVAKESLEASINTIRLTDSNITDANEIKIIQEGIDKEIVNLKTTVLKKQVVKLTSNLKTRIEEIDTKALETRAVEDILHTVDSLINKIESTSDDIGYLKITASLNKLDDTLDTIISNNKDKADATNNLIESLDESVNSIDSYYS